MRQPWVFFEYMRVAIFALEFGLALAAGNLAAGAQLRYGLFEFVTPSAATRFEEGNDATRVPFGDFTDSRDAGLGRVRYQQVVAASEFPGLPSAGVYVRFIAFRSDACLSVFNSGTELSNVVVRLSTTVRSADALSTNLSENPGPDYRQVFSAQHLGFEASGGFCAPGFPVRPAPFGTGIFSLSNSPPFVYAAQHGNLLVELEYSAAAYRRPGSAAAVMDAANSLGDGVSRVWEWSDADGPHSNADSVGLVMSLLFVQPKIDFSTSGNDLLLEWAGPYYLSGDFRLQVTSSLQPGAQWVNFSGPVDTSSTAVYRAKLSLPTQGDSPPRYFRLYSDKVSPAPPSDE